MEDFEFSNILNKVLDGAWSNIIRIGDIKIMLDCGCPESATTNEVFEKIANEANDVDYIFLSHAN